MDYTDVYRSFLGFNPDEANKNLLGEAFKKIGKNTLATDVANSLIGAAAYQPLRGISPLASLAGAQLGTAMADWAKTLLTNNVGYKAPGGGFLTPNPAVSKDLFEVARIPTNFDWSKLVPSGSDLAAAGIATGLNTLGLRSPLTDTLLSGASAASQGFMNPLRDSDFLFKMFRNLGIL